MTEQEKQEQQEWEILTKGGRRSKIMLSGKELIIGELPIKSRGIIFQCMDSDMVQLDAAQREYMDYPSPGFFGSIKSLANAFMGRRKRALKIIEVLTAGISKNDYKLVKACVIPFNGLMTRIFIHRLFWNATYSEIQDAVKKIFDINHIEIKKHLATRMNPSPFNQSDVAQQTSTDGSPVSSNIQVGQETKS